MPTIEQPATLIGGFVIVALLWLALTALDRLAHRSIPGCAVAVVVALALGALALAAYAALEAAAG